MANPYNFILRTQKGSALTHQELDDNFRYLDYAVQNVSGGTGSTTTIISGGTDTYVTGLTNTILFINSADTVSTSTHLQYNGNRLKLLGGSELTASHITGGTSNTDIVLDLRHANPVNYLYMNVGDSTYTSGPITFSGFTMLSQRNESPFLASILNVGDVTSSGKGVGQYYTSGNSAEYSSTLEVKHDVISLNVNNSVIGNRRTITIEGDDAIILNAKQLSTNNGAQIVISNSGVLMSETNAALSYLLTVDGNVRINDNLFAVSPMYLGAATSGSSSQLYWNSSSFNTLLGNNTFTYPASSVRNIIIGDNSVQASVNASDSIVIGSGIAQSATAITDSVVIGSTTAMSGSNITQSVLIGQGVAQMHNGFDNVIIGYHAGYNLDGDGNYGNVLIGANSTANVSTTFFENTIIGETSAVSLTGGTSNVLIGSDVLYNSLVSGDNVIIGDDACQHTTSVGFQNVVIGEEAAEDLTGDNNVIIGYSAGAVAHDSGVTTITSGEKNVLIGSNSASGLTSGSGNILIGSDTHVQSGGISDSIGLGHNVRITDGQQFVLGDENYPVNHLYMGEGVAVSSPLGTNLYSANRKISEGAGSNFTIKPGSSFGINQSGASTFIYGGSGTGSGFGGAIQLNVFPLSPITGSTINTSPVNILYVSQDGVVNDRNSFIFGSQYVNVTEVSNTNYTIGIPYSGSGSAGEYLLYCTNLSTGRTITLPQCNSSEGMVIIVKDAEGIANTHNITIIPNELGHTIDGAPNYIISTNYGSVTLVCDGISNWMII